MDNYMFTILLTAFGLLVFIISLCTAGFKSAFRRLLMFITTGVILDIITFAIIGSFLVHFS